MQKDVVKSTARRLFAFAMVVLLLSQVAMSVIAWAYFENNLLPEMDRKAATVGHLTRGQLQTALDLGIPFDQLAGTQEYFNDILKENPDIGYLAVSAPDGRVLYHSGIDARALEQNIAGVAATVAQRSARDIAKVETTSITADLGGGVSDYSNVAQPVTHQGETVGVLHVGVDEQFIRKRIDDIVFDIGIVLVTSLLIAFELLLFVSTLGLIGPMRLMTTLLGDLSKGRFGHTATAGATADFSRITAALNARVEQVNAAYRRVAQALESLPAASRARFDGDFGETMGGVRQRFGLAADGVAAQLRAVNLVDVRLLTFLFMSGEFLSRPFFPLYVKGVMEPIPGVSDALLMGLPITVFMLMHVLMTPFAARLIGTSGTRRAYIIGAAVSAAGLLGTGFAVSLYDLILWRMLSGAGYAIMFMACQAYVVANTAPENRAQGIAMFVSGLMAAEVCAPAVGGILADRIGFNLVFVLGALIAAGSAFLAARQLQADVPSTAGGAKRSGSVTAATKDLLRNPRFAATVLFAAVPAKLLLTGFLFFLAPVYLTELGATQSEIGRYLMTYGIANVLLASLFARWVDGRGFHVGAVFVGGAITGLALLLGMAWSDPRIVLVGIIVMGIAHALSISAQLALVSGVSRKEIAVHGDATVLAVFRLIERFGSAAGPFVMGLFVTAWGTGAAMAAGGALGMISIAAFILVFVMTRTRPSAGVNDTPAPVGGAST